MENAMKIALHIGVLYVLYLTGAWIQETFDLFIPGSIIGLVLLFIFLMTGVMNASWIVDGARFFIKHLALFFIPATVGIINYLNLFSGKGLLLVVIGLLSTLMVMVSAGHVSQLLIKQKERRRRYE
ncbi:holin-like protein [Lentibacillus persicus]|uniref:Holin-like protein n=1 Tax=Lentibacillus persicus TaxID=640948 RepID=A0A1I1TP85_9BACI|nr:CidA/LrgA family holin-like protein [Lentibacillus persicus]SFD60324.1 holin-like protein [Lentibacillus persicus]